MPDRQQHSSFGALTGVAVASAGVCSGRSGWFAAAAVAGGLAGSSLPDRIDPPLFPGHRGFGHSLIFFVFLVVVMLIAYRCLSDRETRYDSCPSNRPTLERLIAEVVPGFSAGLVAGLSSHLMADATTPSGIRLFCRGF
jgi:membrane-bound metal-dependent hydrolase YbcI (DUF457 family)